MNIYIIYNYWELLLSLILIGQENNKNNLLIVVENEIDKKIIDRLKKNYEIEQFNFSTNRFLRFVSYYYKVHYLLPKRLRKILKNIELSYDDITSELDDIVVTKKGIFLVEVKNIRQDILIDEDGNMYRKEKNVVAYDCNIGEKMNYKEQLLKLAVGKYLKDKNIHSILVFINSNIHVENKYRYIAHSFLGQLPHIINEYEGNKIYTEVDVENIIESIKRAQSNKEYSLEVDIKSFKEDFAELLATLEIGEARVQSDVKKVLFNILDSIKNILKRNCERNKKICRN